MPRIPRRGDDERRRLLAVERAQALEGRSGLLQLNGLADHVDDVQPTLHLGRNTDRQTPPPLPGAEMDTVPDMTAGVSSLDTPSDLDSTPVRPP